MVNKVMFTCYLILLAAIMMFLISFSYKVTSDYGSSPAIMPHVVAVTTVAFCVALLAHEYRIGGRVFPQGLHLSPMLRAVGAYFKNNRKVWVAIGLSLLYVFFMKTVGFGLVTFLYFVAMLFNLDSRIRQLPKGALVAAIFTAITYTVFTYAFGANLPAGILI